jgi:threonine dehydrogenase-like Zn-dependent dehydrogenase
MRALVVEGPGRVSLREVPFHGRPGECTIRVQMAGICGTDLQLIAGYADFTGIPGHEFTGVVEAVSDPRDSRWVGRRVAGEINVGCGACPGCRRGVKEHCASRTVLGIRGRPGAFADYVTLPAANLHAVPDDMDDETAVFVEPVAAACRILEQVPIAPGTAAAVLGDGRLGLIAAQVLRTAAAHVTIIGRHEGKLAVARRLGLAAARAGDVTSQFDVVVDATGRADGLPHALALTRPRGTIVMKTTSHEAAPLAMWPAVVHEVTLVGSRCGPFGPALAHLASGSVQVRPLISRVARLEDCQAAFDASRTDLKVLFRP